MVKRKYSAFLSVLCLLLFLSACSPAAVYRDDRSAAEVLADVEKAVPSEAGYRSVEDDYLSPSTFGEDLTLLRSHVTDWAVAVSDRSDSNPDEILVFHVREATPEQLRAVTDAVRRYGESRRARLADYYRMYAPEQLPKLENLSVKVCGNYVLLTVLDEGQTKKAQAAFEQALV